MLSSEFCYYSSLADYAIDMSNCETFVLLLVWFVHNICWNLTERLFENNKKILAKDEDQGAHTLATRVGARPQPRGPLGAPLTSTPTLYICFRGEKNQREETIVFYDTEPPPSPKTSREGWSRVRSGLRRGEFVAIVIINLPPSPISWCSPPCVSNSIVGLLDGDGLDEVYHVIELVLLGFEP